MVNVSGQGASQQLAIFQASSAVVKKPAWP